jgi:predicted O-methyltransferase YrrM
MGRREVRAEHQRRIDALVDFAVQLEARGLMGPLSIDIDQWAPFLRFAPPGHFYSPIPRLDELAADAERVFSFERQLPGIDLRVDAQRALLEQLGAVLADEQLPSTSTPPKRYYADNFAFGIGDGLVLQGLLRLLAPPRVVEVGSGFSSALLLDTVDEHLPDTSLTFVEPYTELLESMLRPDDRQRCRIVAERVQDVPRSLFDELVAGDVLFIDSTHVVRTGSDVVHLILEVLPRLAPGVVVHVHDIFFPFEQPRPWVEEGRQWAECYLLRAFLTENPAWEIVVWNDFVGRFERPLLERVLPRFLGNIGGSIWLRRVA